MIEVLTSFCARLYGRGSAKNRYSFDLKGELTEMRAHHYLELLPRKPYGPSIVPGRLAFLLERKYSEAISQYSEQVEFIAEHLASKPVRELEQLSTALYVYRFSI